MTDRSPKQGQSEHSPDVLVTCTSAGMPRKVSVRGSEGVLATVAVTVRQGYVWLSIVPPFTWEAIMEPGKVDELIRVLGLARDEAQKFVAVRGRRVASGGNVGVRAIPSESVVFRNKAIGPKQVNL